MWIYNKIQQNYKYKKYSTIKGSMRTVKTGLNFTSSRVKSSRLVSSLGYIECYVQTLQRVYTWRVVLWLKLVRLQQSSVHVCSPRQYCTSQSAVLMTIYILFMYLFIYLSVYLFVYFLFVCLFIYLIIYLFIYLFAYLFICLFLYFLFDYLFI